MLLGMLAENSYAGICMLHTSFCYVVVKLKLQVIHMSIPRETTGKNWPGRKRGCYELDVFQQWSLEAR